MSTILTPVRPSVLKHLDPVALARGLWRHRGLVRQLSAREIQQRYQGAYLGLLWPFVTPALMLAVYAFVFSVVFEARWGTGTGALAPGEFALTLFAGLIPFGVFSEVVTRAPSLVLGSPNYVKKVVFPLEVLPVVALTAAVAHSLISVALLLVANLLTSGRLSPALLLLPAAYLPLLLLTLALGWFLAALGVYVRDLGPAITVATQVLFFLSPIFYPVTAVPDRFRVVVQLNPLTPILDAFRATILWGTPPAWGPWAIVSIASASVAVLGYAWFMQTRKGFADVM